jgi:hypothetical protein
MKPIELRINKCPGFYTVDKVWPGIMNVTYGQRKFANLRDARAWCKLEWHGVPVIAC